MSYCICGGYLGSGGVDGIAGVRWCRCAQPKMVDMKPLTFIQGLAPTPIFIDYGYLIVKNENGEPIGKRKITSLVALENVPAYVVNHTLLVGVVEYQNAQELAKQLEELI